MSKIQLGVIFGSRSCEREVAIISAVQLMNHVDPEKYDVIPVYISEQGVWYTGAPLRDIKNYTPFNPDMKGIDQVAYVRFASVYRQFQDIDTFMAELNKLLGK